MNQQDFEFFLFTLIQTYIGIFSYNGMISCTVNLDKQVKADPQLLADLFVASFQQIYKDICGDAPVAPQEGKVEGSAVGQEQAAASAAAPVEKSH